MRVPRAVTHGSHGHLTTSLRLTAAFSRCPPDLAVLTQVCNYFSGVWLLWRLHFVKGRFFFFFLFLAWFFASFPCSCNFLSHCGFLVSCSCSSYSICTNHYALKLYFRPDAIKCYTFPSFSPLVDVFILQVVLGTLLTKGHTGLALAGCLVGIKCIL